MMYYFLAFVAGMVVGGFWTHILEGWYRWND